MSNKKVSIIVTAHNYGKFLPQALDSALNQTYDNFEAIVVNDGSTDKTEEVLDAYRENARVIVLKLDGVGLAAAANRGIKESSGEYIVRLDADDWFDENLLTVLANYLDRMPDIGLVFGDYYTVDARGEIIGNLRRAKVNDEVELLDRPCLAAGAMYRRECFDAIQGYNESLRYQEDYDFWIKFIDKFKVHNVSLPLMYYRQHGDGMSRNWDARMSARRQVKHKFVKDNRSELARNVIAVIPARGDRINGEPLPLLKLGNETLLARCIRATKAADAMVKVIVSTEDPKIAEHAVAAGAEVPYLRSQRLSSPEAMVENVVADILEHVELDGAHADIAVVCHPHSPFIEAEHIAEVIETLLLYKTDSVLAVVEDLTYHWMIGRHGLTPVGYRERVVRQDKDLIFKEAGSIYAVAAEQFLRTGNFFGERIGHIELSSHDAFRIHTSWDYEVAQQLFSMPERGGNGS